MISAREAIIAFIESIPEEKLTALEPSGMKYEDQNFILFSAHKTYDEPPKFNLQVRANKATKLPALKKISTNKKMAGRYLARVLIPSNETWTAEEIRAALVDSVQI